MKGSLIALTVSGVFLFVLGIVLFRFKVAGLQPSFVAVGVGSLALTLAAVIALAILMVKRSLDGYLVWSLIIGVLPVVVIWLTVGFNSFKKPAIHDISTDLDNPPTYRFASKLRQPTDNSLVYDFEKLPGLQQSHYPEISGRKVAASPGQLAPVVLATFKQLGWAVSGVSEDGQLFEAADRSRLFAFVDDVVVRIEPQEDDSSIIDVRSSSRVGVGDLGANAKRIKMFLQHFCTNLQSKLGKECTVLG